MPFVDPNTVHNPAAGAIAPAAWGDIVRDDLVYLANPPRCRVFNSAAFSVPNVTDQALPHNSESFDTDTMHSTVTETSRITATTAGVYLIGAGANFAANATGTRKAVLRVNGTTAISTSEMANNGSFGLDIPVSATLWSLAANSYVELVVFQNSGGALNVQSYYLWAIWQSQ